MAAAAYKPTAYGPRIPDEPARRPGAAQWGNWGRPPRVDAKTPASIGGARRSFSQKTERQRLPVEGAVAGHGTPPLLQHCARHALN
eukprot:7540550-Lingulodinium_polyedra.AAC.1